jgi:hypothetical protein
MWGVPYTKLFAVIGIGLLITLVMFVFASAASGWLLKVLALMGGVAITFALYGVCVWMERQGQRAKRPTYLRREWDSFSVSQNLVRHTHLTEKMDGKNANTGTLD